MLSQEKPESCMYRLELLKILLDHSHQEANLLWVRNNIFIVINAAVYSLSIRWYLQENDKLPHIIGQSLALFGMVFCAIWWLFNKAGRKMNHAWIRDAKSLVGKDLYLKALTLNALGNDTPSGDTNSGKKIPRMKTLLAATKLNYCIIILFGIAWIYMFIFPYVFK